MKHNTLTIKQVLRQLEDMGVIAQGERSRIWQDYLNMNKVLKSKSNKQMKEV